MRNDRGSSRRTGDRKQKKYKKAREKDKEMVKVVEEIKKVEVRALSGDEWEIEGDLILKEEKMYMPKNEELRLEVIQLYHNILIVILKDLRVS